MEIKRTKKEMAEFLPEVVIKHKGKTTRVDGRDRERVDYESKRPDDRNKKFFLT